MLAANIRMSEFFNWFFVIKIQSGIFNWYAWCHTDQALQICYADSLWHNWETACEPFEVEFYRQQVVQVSVWNIDLMIRPQQSHVQTCLTYWLVLPVYFFHQRLIQLAQWIVFSCRSGEHSGDWFVPHGIGCYSCINPCWGDSKRNVALRGVHVVCDEFDCFILKDDHCPAACGGALWMAYIGVISCPKLPATWPNPHPEGPIANELIGPLRGGSQHVCGISRQWAITMKDRHMGSALVPLRAWSIYILLVNPPFDDLPDCWAAALPASIACWFSLGQSSASDFCCHICDISSESWSLLDLLWDSFLAAFWLVLR